MKKIMATVAAGLALLVGACSDQTQSVDSKQQVSILYPSWAEGVAITNLADVVLTEKGYDVKTTLIEPGPLYASLAKGDADLYLDAWLPYTHADYWQRFGDQIEEVGVVFDDASSGLVVPTYVDITSIEELNNNVDMFKGKIYGIGSGAGLHGLTNKAIEVYNLDYEQVTSSESSMMAELRRAVSAKEPIIITGWKPHYMWDLYDIKLLEDPRETYQVDEIKALSRKGFTESHPEVAGFLSKFSFSSDELHELMAMVSKAEEDGGNAKQGAEAFYEKYKSRIDGWFN